MTETSRYSVVAITLHWVIAAAIIGMIFLGWNMEDNENLFQLHKSIGITILILTIARIIWRLMNPVPPLPSDMKAYERTGSHLVHFGFYVLMLALPLTGWLLVSTSYKFDVPTVLYGVISWPDIPGVGFLKNETGHEAVEFLHSKMAWVVIALLVLHVAGAIKHEIGSEEGVLKRMIPGLFGKADKPSPPPHGFFTAFGVALAIFALIAFVPMLFAGSANGATPKKPQAGASTDISANWDVDHSQSGIHFSGTHDGSTYEGEFANWSAEIAFDPDDLAGSKALVTVQTSSASANKKLYTDSLKSAEWFYPAQYPQATATISDFEKTGDGSYSSTLALTLKDQTVSVPFTFELDINGDEARMKGKASVNRKPLNLGQTSDPNGEWVGETVQIDVEVLASRKS